MSLPIEAYIERDVKHPAITDAMERARRIIDNWLERGTYDNQREQAHDVLVGWSGVALFEAIAEAIIEGQGYDLDELHEALAARPRTGMSVGDCYAAWKPSWPTAAEEARMASEARS